MSYFISHKGVGMQGDRIRRMLAEVDKIRGFLLELLDYENAVLPAPRDDHERLKEITDLRMLLKSEFWPAAVDEEIMDSSQADKLFRAAAIIKGLVTDDIAGRKVLDFGCGDGLVSCVASTVMGAKTSVGYDLDGSGWSDLPPCAGLKLTAEWDTVSKLGPYDVIIANDVLDHCRDFDKQLEMIKSVKSPMGKMFIKCHPWCSRHGAHLHGTHNKAYMHLVFTDDELMSMGCKPEFVHRLLDPLASYRELFRDSGLSVMREEVVDSDVDIFFTTNPHIVRRIKDKWKGSKDERLSSGSEFPHDFLRIETVLYTLV